MSEEKKKNVIPDFRCVEFMRKRRDELSAKWNENPQEKKEELEKIRKKYGIKTPEATNH